MKALKKIFEHWAQNRGVGHTQLMINGLVSTCARSILVARHQEHRQDLHRRGVKAAVITLADVEHGRLDGDRSPLVVDHFALVEELAVLYHHLEQMEKGWKRYEYLRTLSASEFREIYMLSLRGEAFDNIVDAEIEHRAKRPMWRKKL